MSCHKSNDIQTTTSKLLILKVDADTPKFEGGYEFLFTRTLGLQNSLPISSSLTLHGDLDTQTFVYQPNGEIVFKATLVWTGTGEIILPKSFVPPSSFATTNDTSQLADTVLLLSAGSNYFQSEIPQVMRQVSNLSIVKSYMNQHAVVGLYFYPPTSGNYPGPAKWIIFLYVN